MEFGCRYCSLANAPYLKSCQVSMSEYHTLFLTKGGQVYSCGHGLGGRLGFGTEESQLTPKLIQCFVESDACIAIASGSDHSLFLTQNRNVSHGTLHIQAFCFPFYEAFTLNLV